MKKFIKENGLSIVFFVLFIIALVGQAITGYHEFTAEISDNSPDNGYKVSFAQYLSTGHFFQATFENWESEFLQMALFVVLTVSLRQKGSSESKKLDAKDKPDKEPNPRRRKAPWPVKKGGIILKLYENSLSIALFILFILSWLLRDENFFRTLKGESTLSIMQYLTQSRLWFESFQNWQSEFLSVFAIVILSIFLRQKGSPQSKPVDAPHEETGE
ncbi:MAG TPA: DUF6766 family protein [Lentimicrobium sp.]|nr:DUF6766 family protein [Lentimicrobium sp.]